MKRFLLYLLRWQLSTPILALCLSLLNLGTLHNTIIANIIGGCIFFLVDRWLFRENKEDCNTCPFNIDEYWRGFGK